MSSVDSIMRHNKLWVNEDDTRTYLSAPNSGFGRCDTFETTIATIRQNMASSLSHSTGSWWMDIAGKGWWLDDRLMSEMKKQTEIYQEVLDCSKNLKYKPEVAVILDEKSTFTQSAEMGWRMRYLSHESRIAFTASGTTCGYYMLSDLVKGLVPEAKVYVFLNTSDMNEHEREYIRNHLTKDHKTLVWYYGCGFMKDGIASKKNISSLLGMPINFSIKTMSTTTLIKSEAPSPIVKQLSISEFGKMATNPVFYYDATQTGDYEEGKVTVLGNYCVDKRASFVIKEFKAWRSIFIGTPYVNRDIVSNIFKHTGVHMYIKPGNGINFYANDNMIAIYGVGEVFRTIILPKTYTVVNAFSGKIIGKNIKTFKVDFKGPKTKMYLLK